MELVALRGVTILGVEYCLFDRGLPEPLPDKRDAPHFFVPIDSLQWPRATMKYGSNPARPCYGFPVAYLFLERKRPLVTVLLPGGAS